MKQIGLLETPRFISTGEKLRELFKQIKGTEVLRITFLYLKGRIARTSTKIHQRRIVVANFAPTDTVKC
jgi:hypothetical protein